MEGASGRPGLTACLPTLFPDLGRSTDTHLRATLRAARDAGFTGVDLFASHVVQAVEAAAAGGDSSVLVPPANRREAVPAFRAAVLGAPQALALPEAAALRAEIAELGLQVHAVECLSLWATGPPEVARADAEAVCMVAAFLGAPDVVAVCLDPVADPEDTTAGLSLVADVAAEHGLRVVLEWLPGTAVPSLAAAVQLAERAGRPNIGYTVDALHVQCQPGGPDWEGLARLDPRSVAMVQLSDCALPLAEEREPSTRLLPGRGDIDLLRLLRAWSSAETMPALAVEVFDEASLMREGVAGFARQQADALREVLTRAGVPFQGE